MIIPYNNLLLIYTDPNLTLQDEQSHYYFLKFCNPMLCEVGDDEHIIPPSDIQETKDSFDVQPMRKYQLFADTDLHFPTLLFMLLIIRYTDRTYSQLNLSPF